MLASEPNVRFVFLSAVLFFFPHCLMSLLLSCCVCVCDGRSLKWSFGSSLDKKDLRFGYLMRVFFATSGDPSGDARLEWEYVGNMCAGTYVSSTSVAVLQFFQKTSTVLVTYRILDADSLLLSLSVPLLLPVNSLCVLSPTAMAVTVIEAENGKPGIIQYGNMMRLDPDAYVHQGARS